MKTIAFTRRLEDKEAADFNRAVWFDRPDQPRLSALHIMRWLADSAVHDAIVACCGPGTLPVQTRHVHRTLGEMSFGHSYHVTVQLEGQDMQQPGRMELRYLISLDKRSIAEGEIEFLCAPEGAL